MFIRLRMMAHNSLAQWMVGKQNGFSDLDSQTLSVLIDTMSKASSNLAFANELDEVCANAFDEQTAEGFDDVLDLFKRPNGELRDLLTRYGIIHKEDRTMASEYWDKHEYVREHARRTTAGLSHGHTALVRLVEILRTQWDEDYFKAEPFAVRLNGEDFYTFATLDEARKCFDNVEQLYNN